MANALKPSNYLSCRHGAGRQPRAHRHPGAHLRGPGAQRAVWLCATGKDPPRQGPAGRCSTRQLCRVVGVYQKCPLPKTHPRGADAALNSRLHSRPIFSIATRSRSDGEQDFCKTGRQTRSWVVCWVHSLEGPRGEPKGCRSPPSNPPPHRVPREFRKSRVGGGGGWGMRWADSRPTHVQGPIQKTVSK